MTRTRTTSSRTQPATSSQQNKTQEAPSVLSSIELPAGLRTLSLPELQEVADAVRQEMIEAVAHTGGHLGAGLGVVELTVALHATFNTPHDRVIWDVGHQAYPHKILTGRRDRIKTLRQAGGLSGFTKRSESPYDPFGAAHSSTSISAGLGMAIARDLASRHNKVIAVIGDGAITAGMAYEAMNHAGDLGSNLLVILNDNDMSIAPPVGALSHHLTKLVSSRPYVEGRHFAKRVAEHLLPAPLQRAAAKAEETMRAAIGEGSLFEALGFYYMGPVDGHDLGTLLPILENWRDTSHDKPVLLHVRTQKGKGYAPAEGAADKMHGVNRFDIATGQQSKPAPNQPPSYTKVFAQQLTQEAAKDNKIVAITAAMPSGTGLDLFAKEHPSRCFDVGIAEQHAVTFAAGLATEGFKPFVAIYSSFMQRAYDQIVHDVVMQNLPVRFMLDRAGLVGADGYTHAGAFDIAYLGCLPNITLMAASDEVELARMVATAARHDSGPIVLRYPRGNGTGAEFPKTIAPIPVGKGRVLQEGTDIAFLSYGTRLQACLDAAELLAEKGYSVTVADARFAKPLDTHLIDSLILKHKLVITVEEGSSGGFGSLVTDYALKSGLLDRPQRARLRCQTLPDRFQDHNAQDAQYAEAGLDAKGLSDAAQEALR